MLKFLTPNFAWINQFTVPRATLADKQRLTPFARQNLAQLFLPRQNSRKYHLVYFSCFHSNCGSERISFWFLYLAISFIVHWLPLLFCNLLDVKWLRDFCLLKNLLWIFSHEKHSLSVTCTEYLSDLSSFFFRDDFLPQLCQNSLTGTWPLSGYKICWCFSLNYELWMNYLNRIAKCMYFRLVGLLSIDMRTNLSYEAGFYEDLPFTSVIRLT